MGREKGHNVAAETVSGDRTGQASTHRQHDASGAQSQSKDIAKLLKQLGSLLKKLSKLVEEFGQSGARQGAAIAQGTSIVAPQSIVGASALAPSASVSSSTPGAATTTTDPTTAQITGPAGGASGGILMSKEEIARLPTSGAGWDELVQNADALSGSANIADQNSNHDVQTLAAALVYARTGNEQYRAKAAQAVLSAIGTEQGGRTLALSRNLPSYVMAADLIGLKSFDAAGDARFRQWLGGVRTANLDGKTLISTHEDRPNNWGTHAGAARIAADMYLGDTADLQRAAAVFRGWTGETGSYNGFKFGDGAWQANGSAPVGINPRGATIDGHSVDGVIPDDQRRGGGFQWPPPKENYVWEALQGASMQAELLSRAGHDAWSWGDKALLRAANWLHNEAGFPAGSDDRSTSALLNARYNTTFPTGAATGVAKNWGFGGWIYGQ